MGWSTTKEVFDFTIDGPGESIFARHRWLAKMILARCNTCQSTVWLTGFQVSL